MREQFARHEIDGPLQFGNRIAWTSQREQAGAREQSRRPERWVQRRRRLELGKRVGDPAALAQHESEIVMDERSGTAVGQHLAKSGFREIEPAGLEGRHALRETFRQGRRQILPVLPAGGGRREQHGGRENRCAQENRHG